MGKLNAKLNPQDFGHKCKGCLSLLEKLLAEDLREVEKEHKQIFQAWRWICWQLANIQAIEDKEKAKTKVSTDDPKGCPQKWKGSWGKQQKQKEEVDPLEEAKRFLGLS